MYFFNECKNDHDYCGHMIELTHIYALFIIYALLPEFLNLKRTALMG